MHLRSECSENLSHVYSNFLTSRRSFHIWQFTIECRCAGLKIGIELIGDLGVSVDGSWVLTPSFRISRSLNIKKKTVEPRAASLKFKLPFGIAKCLKLANCHRKAGQGKFHHLRIHSPLGAYPFASYLMIIYPSITNSCPRDWRTSTGTWRYLVIHASFRW
jgi:hypothetical protein